MNDDWCIENDSAAQNGEEPHFTNYLSEDDKFRLLSNEINALRHEMRSLYYALKNEREANHGRNQGL